MNILIIGATSGIGKALFVKYANADNRIGIVGRRTNLLNELSQQYPSKTIVSKADVTNLNETEQAINPNRSLENDKKLFLMTAIRKTALYMLDS